MFMFIAQQLLLDQTTLVMFWLLSWPTAFVSSRLNSFIEQATLVMAYSLRLVIAQQLFWTTLIMAFVSSHSLGDILPRSEDSPDFGGAALGLRGIQPVSRSLEATHCHRRQVNKVQDLKLDQ